MAHRLDFLLGLAVLLAALGVCYAPPPAACLFGENQQTCEEELKRCLCISKSGSTYTFTQVGGLCCSNIPVSVGTCFDASRGVPTP